MPALRERDFDALASGVVDRFLREGTKLADGAADVAIDSQLNPDQIERLVQAANTMAFLRTMEARQADNAPDLTHEFEPADTRMILQRILSSAPVMDAGDGLEGAASPVDDHAPLPDETRSRKAPPGEEKDSNPPIKDQDGPFPARKGKEPSKEQKPPASPSAKDNRKEAMVRTRQLTKLATVFEDQLVEAEIAFDEGFDRMRTQFKRASGAPSFDAFEKDAMAVEGDEHGIAVINLLRTSRGMETLAVDDALRKCASLHDRHLADDYPALREFRQLVKIARHASRVTRAVDHVRSLCG